MIQADYIIIGAGPAGCVLAERLSADSATRVLLLEAGTGRTSRFFRLLARVRRRDLLRWQYETVPQSSMNDRSIYLPQGRALGGGSAINAMTYVRGRPGDYDAWVELGNHGWDYASVLEAFKALEDNHSLSDDFHARGGLLDVSDPVRPHPLTSVFLAAAAEVGLPHLRDFNGAAEQGAGIYQVTQLRGERRSAAAAFLGPARGRPNLTVLTGAQVTRINLERGRATSVDYVRSGCPHRAQASAEILLCAGAINSPRLLLLSGIGPAAELRALGIPVHHDLPGTGRNLQDHLNVPVIVRCARPITYDHWNRTLRFTRFGLQYLLFHSGVAISNLCEGGAFLRADSAGGPADLQLHFLPLIWLNYGRTRVEGSGMTLEAALLHPESRGTVTLASPDPLAPPRIDPRYCSAPHDLSRMTLAIRRCRELWQTRAFQPFVDGELYPGTASTSDAELATHVRACGVSACHPVGTCRMGIDDLAVVAPSLEVRGLRSLRVIDSSIMPTIVGGSTQAPSMMIGEMGARMILAGRR